MGPDELAFAGLARQAELVRTGEVSPRELVELALARIGRLDGSLRSFRVVFAERALGEARQAQARRRTRRAAAERPLLGVPVAVKDDVDVAGEVTAYGAAPVAPPAAADAAVVARLRAAGAIVIGKTNVPELTQWPFTESAAWGATRNPWDLARTPGGSSGGSAAAVAAGLVPAALGSDGAGSIRIPAACCGIVGLKPQRDRVPLAPAVERWHGMAAIGPLARRVIDAALLLDAIADRAGRSDPRGPDGSFAAAVASAPGRLRIAVSTKPPLPGPVGADVRRGANDAADVLRGLGHEVSEHDPDYLPAMPQAVARYLRGIHDEVAAFPEPRRLERRTRGMGRLGGLIPAGQLARMRAREEHATARLQATFDEHDVLCCPILAGPPAPVGRWEGRGALWTFNAVARWVPFLIPWNLAGNPALAVPVGFDGQGLPLAVQLVGRPHAEATLLALAAQLEAARPWADRRPPIS